MSDSTAPLIARLFGAPEILVDGVPLARLRSRKGQILLFHLILRDGAETSRDWLCDVLWPDSLLDQARLSLRQSLVDLRKALGPEASRLESPTTKSLRFVLEGAEVDVLEFDAISKRPSQKAADVDRAIELYRGPLLFGWIDDHLVTEQELRRSRVIELLERRADLASEVGDREAATNALRRAIALNPLHESAHRRLMRELVDGGNAAEALEVFRSLRIYLRDHLRMEPDAQTIEAYRAVRASLQQRHQTQAKFAPRNFENTSLTRTLPQSLTPLIGREEDVRRIQDLLAETRIVTVTGPGGVGKTRAAIEAARRIDDAAEFEHGVTYVSLVEARQFDVVADQIGAALGIVDRTQASGSDMIEAALRSREMLLVLDNCEHVLDDVANVVISALSASSRIKILATSREPLAIDGEQVLPIGPLDVPREEDMVATSCASVQLFLDRARRTRPGFRADAQLLGTVGRICRRLDGIPLAIELAAARVKTLSIEQIESKIEDRFALLQVSERGRHRRHQTMEGALETSYRQLDESSQRAFREFSIFEEGFTLEGAEAISTSGEALAHLARLLDASLLHIPTSDSHPLRYGMLETIREFGMRKLHESGEYEFVRNRHFEYMSHLIDHLAAGMFTSAQLDVISRINSESANWRAALRRCDDDTRFLRLLVGLAEYFRLGGNPREYRRWFESAVARVSVVERTLRIETFVCASSAAFNQMDIVAARSYVDAAASELRGDDAPELRARVWNALGLTYRVEGNLDASYQFAVQAVDAARELSGALLGTCLGNFGITASELNRFDDADDAFAHLTEISLALGLKRTLAFSLNYRGLNDVMRGDRELAKDRFWQSALICREIGDDYRFTWLIRNVFRMCLMEERFEIAASLCGAIESWQDRLGFASSGHHFHRFPKDMEVMGAALGTETCRQRIEYGAQMSPDEVFELVRRACETLS